MPLIFLDDEYVMLMPPLLFFLAFRRKRAGLHFSIMEKLEISTLRVMMFTDDVERRRGGWYSPAWPRLRMHNRQ